MRARHFFLASIFAAFIALCLHIAARDQDVKSVSIRAHSWNHNDTEKIQMRVEATRCKQKGDVLFYVGLVFTFSGLGCLIAARNRHEPGWYSIPILLLLTDVMTQMLL